jgi:hypothetical protein
MSTSTRSTIAPGTTLASGSESSASGFFGGVGDAALFVLLAVVIVAVLVGVALFSGQLDRAEPPPEENP